jgi:hypothetical protein
MNKGEQANLFYLSSQPFSNRFQLSDCKFLNTSVSPTVLDPLIVAERLSSFKEPSAIVAISTKNITITNCAFQNFHFATQGAAL